ncbi:glucosamine-6-phosphate deaminase [Propionibacteriaceae bacterium G57]|uniref:glucosamine-6-phosphate deaminase n=1 Tax=Aestuariimicrobium sp. G57 TaxID=3418485 RepID=UPI003DA7394C
MEVIICASEGEVATMAAARIAEALSRRPDPVMGLATGSSPLGTYAKLKERVDSGKLDLTRARFFALDEYIGLPPSDPNSYAETIRTTFTEPLGVNPAQVRVPDGMAADIDAACDAYEAAIRDAGGIDAQILGIGSNGHIGFNEPGSSFASRTRPKTLTATTRADNARFFGEGRVPTHCVTQGLGTIMDAGRLVLTATGAKKAAAVAAAVEGPVTAMCPASILQFHRYATVVVDEAAASKLQLHEYYRDTFDMLPEGYRPH